MQFERRLDARLILSILATGIMTFCGMIEETAMNITFPTLMEEFKIPLSYVQWITTGYLLMLIIMMPTSAYLKKRMKMKTLFMAAALAFLAGMILCFTAKAFFWIIIGRAVQGAAAGLAVPLMYNIVLEQSPYEHMGFIMGFATMTNAMAPALGPVYGGAILQLANWRMIFGCLIPVIVIVLILGMVSIRQSSVREDVRFDTGGFILFAAALGSLIFGLNLPNVFGWASPAVIVLLICAAVFLVLFIKKERATVRPLLNLNIFRTPVFALSVICVYCCCTICPTCSFMLPNFLQMARAQNALSSAGVLFFGCVTGALVSMLGGNLFDKKGPKIGLRVGALFALAGTVGISLSLPSSPLPVIALMFVVYMVAQGLCVSTNMAYSLRSLPDDQKADGNAVMNITQNLSGTIGIVISSGIISTAQAAGGSISEGALAGSMITSYILIGIAVALNILENRILMLRGNKM